MTQKQFDVTRAFLKKYVLHYAPTTMERLGYSLDDRFYGVEGSHLEIFRAMMDRLSLSDVQAAIAKQWQYGRMQIAIVTRDASSLVKALTEDAPSPITYKTPKPAALISEDRDIAVFPLKINPDQMTVVQVNEVFQR
jgi:zinc protease